MSPGTKMAPEDLEPPLPPPALAFSELRSENASLASGAIPRYAAALGLELGSKGLPHREPMVCVPWPLPPPPPLGDAFDVER